MHSKDDLNLALKTTLCVGFCWFEPSFRAYCSESLVRLSHLSVVHVNTPASIRMTASDRLMRYYTLLQKMSSKSK